MENLTGSKYLHKKFKKPTTSISYTSTPGVTIGETLSTSNAGNDRQTQPKSIYNNENISESNVLHKQYIKVNSVSSINNSSSISLSETQQTNDQVASISTSVESVPSTSSIQNSKPQSSANDHILRNENHIDSDRNQSENIFFPPQIKEERNSPTLDIQNRNVDVHTKFIRGNRSPQNISASESDKNGIIFNTSSLELSSASSRTVNNNSNSIVTQSPSISTYSSSKCTVTTTSTSTTQATTRTTEIPSTDVVDATKTPTSTTSFDADTEKKVVINSETNQGGKYVCSYCNLSCSKPSVLQKHIRAHTNERPYPCLSCGFSFKTRSNLYKHCRSRSHANRAKDTPEVVAQSMNTAIAATKINEIAPPPTPQIATPNTETKSHTDEKVPENVPKAKPYKPKFHKLFLLEQNNENEIEKNEEDEKKKVEPPAPKAFSSELVKQNPDLLKQHITNLIHKNQTILDVKEPNFLKKRFLYQVEPDENHKTHGKSLYESNFHVLYDEPLNLTARNRKRCMSETEHTQKSLIKELLLKNLTQEQSYVCQFCKISFKNIENFEIHRKNYCKVGENPTSKDIAFVRSHSVNVASVLTQKYSRNNESPSKFVRTTLPLKSPGPFLGKTSLIGEKTNQVFYENRNPTRIHHPTLSLSSDNFKKLYEKNDMYSSIKTTENGMLLSKPIKNDVYTAIKSQDTLNVHKPITLQENEIKKRSYDDFQYSPNLKKPQTPIKLFGGEVKITETSGETRSFKIDSKNVNDYSPNSPQYIYGNKVSENMMVKSSLQSGGTILQNTPTYETKISPFTPKLDEKAQIFQFYDTKISSTTPPIPRKPYDNDVKKESNRFSFSEDPSDIYTQRFWDYNQKAVKIFAPNLKQPNLTIPGLPVPNKVFDVPIKRCYPDNFEQQISPHWTPVNSRSMFENTKFTPTIKFRQDANIHKPESDILSSKIDAKPIPVETPRNTPLGSDMFPSPVVGGHIVLTQPESDRNSANTVNINAPGLRLYDPLNIFINGKLVRYVPGMPGPESGNPIQIGFAPDAPIMSTQVSPKVMKTSPLPPGNTPSISDRYIPGEILPSERDNLLKISQPPQIVQGYVPNNLKQQTHDKLRLSPNVKANEPPTTAYSKSPIYMEKKIIEVPNKQPDDTQRVLLKNVRIVSENSSKSLKTYDIDKSEIRIKSPAKILESREYPTETSKIPLTTSEPASDATHKPNKFLRPNSLAIKPYMSIKNHHGLTPTIFNQALISPDTPRVAKKNCKLYLNGNCLFSSLGLKSSTKPTYCTLNKTQPFYVQCFGTLSMYSEWRHLECKLDYVRMDTYDSRQRKGVYSTAQSKMPDLVVDSSYKSVMVESSQKKDDPNNRSTVLPGGYESNEDYTYIRGRGRGRYVCDQCGIRCKKPSMLKKHIRTHSDVRPYTCRHCNFSFKTKGNLTKHMKSKAHYKRTTGAPCSEANGENHPSQCSTPSVDDSDSDMDNDNDSDDSTRLQDHEAAHCLLSLSQNRSPVATTSSESTSDVTDASVETCTNHSLSDQETGSEISVSNHRRIKDGHSNDHQRSVQSSSNVFENMTSRKPLTYPYYKVQVKQQNELESQADMLKSDMCSNFNNVILGAKNIEIITQNLENFKNSQEVFSPKVSTPTKIHYLGDKLPNADLTIANFQQKFVKYEQERQNKMELDMKRLNNIELSQASCAPSEFNRKRMNHIEKLDVSDGVPENKRIVMTTDPEFQRVQNNNVRKRHISVDLSHMYASEANVARKRKLSYPDLHESELKSFVPLYEDVPNSSSKPYDSHPRGMDLTVSREYVENRIASARNDHPAALDLSTVSSKRDFSDTLLHLPPPKIKLIDRQPDADVYTNIHDHQFINDVHHDLKLSIKRKVLNLKPDKLNDPIAHHEPIMNNVEGSERLCDDEQNSDECISNSNAENNSDNISAMQTLAEIAMKRVSVENTKLAQSVATEYLKLATKNDIPAGVIEQAVPCNGTTEAGITDLIVKSEENKSCTICAKNFSKPSQLRLHMNIHYIERPFRCESCSVSFRSKGHLQKHERSASHHNKLSSSPTTSSSEPRPFKCSDCNIAFRIHGHLAKHLRSKMHIMRLECLARVPFGLYAELERANSLLTEINTTDCDMCLESLKILARKLFSNDPNKLVQIENPSTISSNIQDQQIAVGSP